MTNQELISKLNGILLPFTTPFSKDGQILSADLVANLDRWNFTGITGYAALGSTGERVHLDEREYLQIIETSRAAVPGSLAFIAGAGQQSVIGTVNEVKKAAQAGADAVLVITPSFYRTAITQQALLAFYRAVADASPVPVLLYSMPALTGIKIEPATIAELSSHPNIIGVKDSSNDIAGFKSTVELCPRSFAVMTGNGTVLLDALRAGATGGILAVGCTVPEICVEILRAHRAGEAEAASELQTKLTPLAAAVTTRFGIGGLKTALELSGYRGGVVRDPLRMPDPAACAEIEELLATATSALKVASTT
ncbi:MAG TPA: dihydrodipicolinate synthase family protein [Pyrinomonadaceae bacterium]|nr:dihydrodipicolinate synthase family protein [Pyrinomonadaceae bacterium]